VLVIKSTRGIVTIESIQIRAGKVQDKNPKGCESLTQPGAHCTIARSSRNALRLAWDATCLKRFLRYPYRHEQKHPIKPERLRP
jgi:hypothetical protein